MGAISMKQLLEAGVHFGHQAKKWDPRMKPFIFQARNGIHIIDLQQTVVRAQQVYDMVKEEAAKGKTVMFVGTKKQAVDSIRDEAERCAMPYVTQRWLGGFLTNFKQLHTRIEKLRQMHEAIESNNYGSLTKKEIKLYRDRYNRLKKFFWGVRNLDDAPDYVFILDLKKEATALNEARKVGIPVIALVDTNCNPNEVDYPIPANDDAIRSIDLFCKMMANAVIEGRDRIAPQSGDELKDPIMSEEKAAPAAAPVAAPALDFDAAKPVVAGEDEEENI